MSPRLPETAAEAVFAALGDSTRLAILGRLAEGQSLPLSEIAGAGRLTRQGVTKHLAVLERAGLVSSRRAGRERRFVFEPGGVGCANAYLAAVLRQWDAAIERLRRHVEAPASDP